MTVIPGTPAHDTHPSSTAAAAAAAPRRRVALTRRERTLFDAICRFGQSGESDDLAPMRSLYLSALRTITIARRLRLLDMVADRVRDGSIGALAYQSFMFHESQPRVIARAAALATERWPADTGDPLHGARELAGFARAYARMGEESRAVGLFAGVALLGAAQAFTCAGRCWRTLTPNGCVRLARLLRREAHEGIGEWLKEWLDECAARECHEVAKTLAATSRRTRVHPTNPPYIRPPFCSAITAPCTSDSRPGGSRSTSSMSRHRRSP